MRFRALALPVLAAIGCTTSSNGPSGGTDADTDADAGTGGEYGEGLVAGSVTAACTAGIPPAGRPADVSHPTSTVGDGTAESCTFDALEAAVAGGGVVVFDCGPDPATVPVTSTIELPIDRDTVIDGGGRITLDGGDAVRILRFYSPNFQHTETRVTLQHIALVHGKTTPAEAIPRADPPCSQGYNDGEGGALYMRDGNLTVIDAVFAGNQGAALGPDTGGGAVYVVGSKHGVLIVHSTLSGNHASNGGAVGCLFSELDVYDSLVTGDFASGHDANNNDPSQCDSINNGQHEIGSGGNGGGLYSDGAASSDGTPSNIVLCGDEILDNAAGDGAFGGGIFFTSNDYSGTLSIVDSTITGNTGGHWTNVAMGSVTSAGDAVGTNAKSITIVNSEVQGVP